MKHTDRLHHEVFQSHETHRLHHEVFPSHEIYMLLNETDERVAAAAVSSKYF